MEWHHWWHCWHNVTLTAASIVLHNQKSHNNLILIIRTEEMQWCHWWCHWHHMMVMLMPVASHPESHVALSFDLANGMVPLMTLFASCETDLASWHYVTKSYITHCFNYINLMNTVVWLTIALASHGTDASANSVNDWKSHVESHFNHLKVKKKQQYYWWYHQCHVMLTLASHD